MGIKRKSVPGAISLEQIPENDFATKLEGTPESLTPRSYRKGATRHYTKTALGGDAPYGFAISTNYPVDAPHAESPTSVYSARSVLQEEPEQRARHYKSLLWAPWSLRAYTFAFLGGVFAVMIGALEVLSFFDRRRDGWDMAWEGRKHYLSAYLPPAVVLILAAIWARVEYSTRQLMPWKVLANGPSPASHSILLDYITPLAPLALLRALRMRHIPVILAITGTLLLALLAIASAGLFALRPQITQTPASFRASDLFTADGFKLDGVTADPALAYAGARQAGLALPQWTAEDWAVQAFAPVDNTTSAQASSLATVDALTASLDCERASTIDAISHSCATLPCHLIWGFEARAPSCSFNPDNDVDGGVIGTTGAVQRFGRVMSGRCANATGDARRMAVITGYLHLTKDANVTALFDNATALVCKPLYAVHRAAATIDGNAQLTDVVPDTSAPRQLTGLSPWDLALGVWAAVNRTDTTAAPAPKHPFTQADAFIELLASTHPTLDLDSSTDLRTAINGTFAGIAAQLARTHLTAPASNTVTGSLAITSQVLALSSIALRFMEALLALLLLLTLALFLTRPAHVTPRDTSTPGGLAAVLAGSELFTSALAGLGAARADLLASKMRGRGWYYTFLTADAGGQHFALGICAPSENHTSSHEAEHTRVRESLLTETAEARTWWNPLSDAARIAILGAILAALIAVELLHQRSQRSGGITDVHSSGARFAAQALPPLVMLLVGALVGVASFSTLVLQPYAQLREASSARKSILLNYLSAFPAVALVRAARNRHWAVVGAASALVLTPLLAIVAAGLFVPTSTGQLLSVDVRAADTLNAALNKTALPASLPLLTNLLTAARAPTYPPHTHDALVFPRLNAPGGFSATGLTGSALSARVLALRPGMNCTSAPAGGVKIWLAGTNGTTGANGTMHVALPVPRGCGQACLRTAEVDTCGTNETYIYFSGAPATAPFGRVFQPVLPANVSASCPTIGAIWGQPGGDGAPLAPFTGLTCVPHTEAVDADATFALPDFTLLSATPDAATAKPVKGVAGVDFGALFPAGSAAPDADVDPAFRAALTGADIKASQLGSSAPADVSAITAALTTLYGRTAAQVLSIQARGPAPGGKNASVAARLRIPGRQRLAQDTLSTRLLQGLLGAMLVCLGVAAVGLDTRRVVPRSVASVASVGALVADGGLASREV
ncbi:hypothetical protein EJ06DRAFT_556427, partial [Trichodelitschia bisporula]